MAEFTHFNEQGRAKMVDVGEKPVTDRTAVAAGRVLVNRETASASDIRLKRTPLFLRCLT